MSKYINFPAFFDIRLVGLSVISGIVTVSSFTSLIGAVVGL